MINMAIRNFYSLTVDEAILADRLKENSKKYGNFEVFIPTTPRLKDMDLILMNMKNREIKTIQVKGSATYTPRKSETAKFGAGNSAWIQINKKSIFDTQNKVDFFVFVIHNFIDKESTSSVRKDIRTNFIIIPSDEFQKKLENKKLLKNGQYSFFFWVNNETKTVTEFSGKQYTQDYSEYLNK